MYVTLLVENMFYEDEYNLEDKYQEVEIIKTLNKTLNGEHYLRPEDIIKDMENLVKNPEISKNNIIQPDAEVKKITQYISDIMFKGMMDGDFLSWEDYVRKYLRNSMQKGYIDEAELKNLAEFIEKLDSDQSSKLKELESITQELKQQIEELKQQKEELENSHSAKLAVINKQISALKEVLISKVKKVVKWIALLIVSNLLFIYSYKKLVGSYQRMNIFQKIKALYGLIKERGFFNPWIILATACVLVFFICIFNLARNVWKSIKSLIDAFRSLIQQTAAKAS